MSAVAAAIKYADLAQHGGHGYTLRLQMRDGSIINGAVVSVGPDYVQLEVARMQPEKAAEVFVTTTQVVTVTIDW